MAREDDGDEKGRLGANADAPVAAVATKRADNADRYFMVALVGRVRFLSVILVSIGKKQFLIQRAWTLLF
jgi:hypothetical protein